MCRTESDLETVSAATGIFYVRIREPESFVQTFACIIQFRTVKIRKTFRIDENPDAVGFENPVVGLGFVNIFQFVRHAGTAGCLYAES